MFFATRMAMFNLPCLDIQRKRFRNVFDALHYINKYVPLERSSTVKHANHVRKTTACDLLSLRDRVVVFDGDVAATYVKSELTHGSLAATGARKTHDLQRRSRIFSRLGSPERFERSVNAS